MVQKKKERKREAKSTHRNIDVGEMWGGGKGSGVEEGIKSAIHDVELSIPREWETMSIKALAWAGLGW